MYKLNISALLVVTTLLDLTVAGLLNKTVECSQGAVGRLDGLDVQECDSLPCVFVKGQKYTISTRFTPKGNVQNLTITISARVFLGTDLTFFRGDVCEYLGEGKSCPLRDGVTQNFKVDFRMSQFIPPLSTKVMAIVRDDKDNVQVCAKLPVKIVSRKNN